MHYDHGTGVAAADVDGDGRTDLYFVSQLGTNELWRNLGGGRFENITARAGVGLTDRICVAASFADVDNDGDADLFVTTVRQGNVLFENTGGGRFRDITAQAGLGYRGHSSGAVFFDFDRDGRLDVFLCNIGRYTTEERGAGGYYVGVKDGFYGHMFPERSEASILYRNLGGNRFEDVSKAMQLEHRGWSGDATFTDLNEDGYPDLYVCNMQGDDRYYENQGGRRFVDRTDAVFPKTPWGAMNAKFFDFNRDGRLDLYVVDMHSDMSGPQVSLSRSNTRLDFEKSRSDAWCSAQWTEAVLQGSSNNIFGNALLLNEGGGRFADISQRANAETLWPWGVSVGDLNADGFEDAVVTAGMGFGFRYALNSVLLNEAGRRFVDAEFLVGLEPRAGGRFDKIAFHLDCAGADRGHPLCKGQAGTVPVREVLSSRSSVLFDLDGDGDLDLVTNEMNDRPQVLVSNLSARRPVRYLQIRLVGTRSNRDGLGALVRVHAGGQVFTRQHDGKSGYLAQSALPLYFGLGDATRVEQIEVTWPAGGRQVLTEGLPINDTYTVTEPR